MKLALAPHLPTTSPRGRGLLSSSAPGTCRFEGHGAAALCGGPHSAPGKPPTGCAHPLGADHTGREPVSGCGSCTSSLLLQVPPPFPTSRCLHLPFYPVPFPFFHFVRTDASLGVFVWWNSLTGCLRGIPEALVFSSDTRLWGGATRFGRVWLALGGHHSGAHSCFPCGCAAGLEVSPTQGPLRAFPQGL